MNEFKADSEILDLLYNAEKGSMNFRRNIKNDKEE